MDSKYNNVVDNRKDKEGNEIQNLKMYGDLSERAYMDFDPMTFTAFSRITRMSSKELCIMVREYYSKTFHDLCGVNLFYLKNNQPTNQPNVNNNNNNKNIEFMFEFYFKKNDNPVPEGKITNLEDLTKSSDPSHANNYYYQKQILDNKASGKHYTINNETKLLMKDITIDEDNNGTHTLSPNSNTWNRLITEVVEPTIDWSYNRRGVDLIVKVSGLNASKILYKVFGNVMVIETNNVEKDDGSVVTVNKTAHAMYAIRYMEPVKYDPNAFIVHIEQFDENKVSEFISKERPFQPYNPNGIIYY